MSDNIDDWLSSIGLGEEEQHSTPTNTEQEDTQEEAIPIIETTQQEPSLPEPVTSSVVIAQEEINSTQTLSESDYDDILSDMGFQESQAAEAEEVISNTEETVSISIGEEQVEVPVVHEGGHQEGPLIPPNSPTLLINDATSRFSGTEWYEEIQKQHVLLAGLGGIGSWTALMLARLCPESMLIMDPDTVERANLSGQLYSMSQCGQRKAHAVAETISDFTTEDHVFAYTSAFTPSTDTADVMICGFDNMDARRIFFDSWVRHLSNPTTNKEKCLFIDGRLSISDLQVLCIRGDDEYNIARYDNEFLFSSSEAENTVCSMKQTTYLACMIGSIISNLFVNFVAGTLNPVIPYDLPFFTVYDAQNMIFKTEN